MCLTAFTTSDIMSLQPIDHIFHVTNEKICAKIMKEKSFKLYRATDSNYDGALAAEDAPPVVFFTGSYFGGNLPTKSIYPRCSGFSCKKKSVAYSLKLHILPKELMIIMFTKFAITRKIKMITPNPFTFLS